MGQQYLDLNRGGEMPFTLSYSLQYVNIETVQAAVCIGRVLSIQYNIKNL